ncbi:alpha/beta hydrolase [Herbiconiux sp.]|uniref:alpha/beta fold hydrolase n=1 Tax=Herbiconiux sp. TaxID=1871186 RepID=UPI0025BB6821|nr:alpha/beta hydrolase [Herbiconiux sp.]
MTHPTSNPTEETLDSPAESKDHLRFVLVHGSWHDGRCWDQTATLLESSGHEVHSLTLPGNGTLSDPSVTMEQTAAAVVDLIRNNDLHDVVIVGHSFGGAVVQLAALQVPDRLRRIVFYNAYVLENGASIFSYVPPSVGGALAGAANADGTMALPYGFWRDHLINDADTATAQAAYEFLCPEPLARSSQPVDLTGFDELPVPRSYLYAYEDNVYPAAEFTWHPGMSQRLGDFRLVVVPGGHELMFSAPSVLAEGLVASARD